MQTEKAQDTYSKNEKLPFTLNQGFDCIVGNESQL